MYFVPKVYCDDTNAVMADANTVMARNVEIAAVIMEMRTRFGYENDDRDADIAMFV